MKLPRWLWTTIAVVNDMRDVSRSLDRHPDRVSTDRDHRLHREESGDAISVRGLAHRRRDVGNVAGAAEALEQLVALRTQAWGADDPLVLGTRLTLAGMRGQAGDAAGAADGFEQLIADTQRVLGEDHLYPMWARRNAAYWRDGARKPGRKAPAQWVPGRQPADIVALRRLARWWTDTEFASDASDQMNRLLGYVYGTLGSDHPYTTWVRRNLDSRWRNPQRTPLLWRASVNRNLPTNHFLLREPLDTAALQRLVEVRGNLGDEAGAVEAAEQLLTARLRVLAWNHPVILLTRFELAGLRGKAGDIAGALDEAEQLLPDTQRVLGDDHPFTLFTRLILAGLRGETGEPGAVVVDHS